MNTTTLTAAGVAATFLCASALAQHNDDTDSPNHGDVENVIVTAVPLDDVLQPADVLADEELALKSAASIGEALAGELGVSSSYFGPASSRPIIRGLSGSRVKMLSDSVSTLDVSDVSPDHAVTVEPLLADQIEIIRGPTALLYGSAAAGGVVNVVENRIHEVPLEAPFSGGFEMRADTASEERSFVGRLDGGVGAFSWHVDGYDKSTENIDIDGFATADPAEREEEEESGTLANSYSESDGFAGAISWSGDRGYVGASYSVIDSTYGLPGAHEEHEHEEGEEEEEELFEGPFIDMEQTRVDLRGEYRFDNGAFESAKLSFGTNDYEHNEIEPSGEIGTRFDNEAWQGRIEVIHAPIGGWRGAIGLQYDDRDFSAVGEEAFISPTVTEAVGVFIVEERDYDWGHLHVGARIESMEHDSSTLADYDENALSFSAGLGVPLSETIDGTINVSRTQRNPNAEELYSDGAHLATGQFEIGLLADGGTDVTTEDSLNVDIGLTGQTDALTWELSAFYTDFSDYIYQNLTGDIDDDLPVAVYAQEDAEFYGFEGAVTFNVLPDSQYASEVRLFADHVEAELDNGDDLPRLPPFRVGANIDVDRDAWLAGLDVVYHAERDDISSFNTDSYTMVDARFVYRLDWQDSRWSLFARGSNLLDEDARKSTSFLADVAPLPGRSFHVGVRARF